MKDDVKKYKDNDFVVFSINIIQKQNKSGIWKKDIAYVKDWEKSTIDNSYYNAKYNGLSLLTGKINNIIVVDIDNLDHWDHFLDKYGKEEPYTVKAISGSGGIHLYFKYTEDLNDIKSSSKCFDSKYDIDIRTNGGNIIVPPTSYFNKALNKDVKYIWENSIFEVELASFPSWMKKILINKNNPGEVTIDKGKK
jgi:hypothetical protein